MKYLSLGKTGLKVSTIGLGCEHIGGDLDETNAVIREAVDGGINFMDVFMAQPDVRDNIGKSLLGIRDKVCIQGHFGSVMCKGQPTQSREIGLVQTYFEDFLKRMHTDYVDIGYIHFIDREEDYQKAIEGGLIEYAQRMKKEGKIRAIGLSTHRTEIAHKAIQDGIIDCLMFPISAAFDLMPKEQNIFDIFVKQYHNTEVWTGMEPSRQMLYEKCMEHKIPIVSMKPLGGGMLLNEELSPFGKAMTVHQCVNYVLHNPAAVTAMVGCKSVEEVKYLLSYYDKSEDEVDYSKVLAHTSLKTTQGKCTYCNHCLPCPENIDIAAVMRYKDIINSHLAADKEPYIVEHYKALEKNADDCIACGACMKKCPFGVNIIDEMKKIRKDFTRHTS